MMGQEVGEQGYKLMVGGAYKRFQRVIADGPETLIEPLWSGASRSTFVTNNTADSEIPGLGTRL